MLTQVLVSSTHAGPQHFGLRGQVGKVHKHTATQELSYWLLAESNQGKLHTFRVKAEHTTPVAELPALPPTVPAPLRLDARLATTKDWYEDARSKIWGNNDPDNVKPAEHRELTEVQYLGLLLHEIS